MIAQDSDRTIRRPAYLTPLAAHRFVLPAAGPLRPSDCVQQYVDLPAANHGAATQKAHFPKARPIQDGARRGVLRDSARLEFVEFARGEGFIDDRPQGFGRVARPARCFDQTVTDLTNVGGPLIDPQ